MKMRYLLTSSALVLGMTALPAWAQTQSGRATQAALNADSDDSTIVVTAQKRRENVQKVGISVTALDSKILKSLNVTSGIDITSQVPSLQSSQVGLVTVNYSIRGVSQNDYADHLEPPVAVYIDDAYLSTLPIAGQPVFDLQRAEVLRGPQGTLFGRNATGGLIRFVTNQPTKENEGYVKVTAGEYSWTRVEAAVSGPITGNLQIRAAGDIQNQKGYIKSLSGGATDAPGSRALGAVNYRAGRITLAWQPTSNLDVSAQGRYTQFYNGTGSAYEYAATTSDAQGLGRFVRPDENPYGTGLGCAPAPALCYEAPGHYKSYLNSSGNYRSKWYGGTLKADLTLGDFVLTSVSDVQHYEKYFDEDADGSPYSILDDLHTANLNQFSQELRAFYKSGPLAVTAGGYYLQFKTKAYTNYTLGAYNTFVHSAVETRSGAAFLQGEVKLTSDITAIGGIRYTRDTKQADYSLFDNAGTTPFVFNTELFPDLAKRNYNLLSGKAMLQWQATSDLMMYASYNRGTKSGGFEFAGFLPVVISSINHSSETLHAFEIGEKLSILGGRLRLNSSAFYYDYKNYQAYFFNPIPGGFVQTIGNRDARVYGFEAEINSNPIDGLTANVGVSVLRTTVFDVSLPNGSLADKRLPQAPKLSGNLLLRYEHGIGAGEFVLSEQFDMNYKSGHCLSVLCGETEREGRYAIGNLQVALSPASQRWQLAIFARNVWNQRYRIFSADLSSLATIAQGYARPRTIGGSMRFDF